MWECAHPLGPIFATASTRMGTCSHLLAGGGQPAASGHACPLRASILPAGWSDWLVQQANMMPSQERPSVVSETRNQRPTPPGSVASWGPEEGRLALGLS